MRCLTLAALQMVFRPSQDLYPVTVSASRDLVVCLAQLGRAHDVSAGCRFVIREPGACEAPTTHRCGRRLLHAYHEGSGLPQGIRPQHFAAVQVVQCMLMVFMGGAWIGGTLGMMCLPN